MMTPSINKGLTLKRGTGAKHKALPNLLTGLGKYLERSPLDPSMLCFDTRYNSILKNINKEDITPFPVSRDEIILFRGDSNAFSAWLEPKRRSTMGALGTTKVNWVRGNVPSACPMLKVKTSVLSPHLVPTYELTRGEIYSKDIRALQALIITAINQVIDSHLERSAISWNRQQEICIKLINAF